MHTLAVIALGVALLAACLFAGQLLGGSAGVARGALVFLPLWLAGALLNMYVGVHRAGYSVREELPVLLVVFAAPAVLAAGAWCKFTRP